MAPPLATALVVIALALDAAPLPATANAPPASAPPLEAARAAVAAHIPGAKASELRTTPVPGIYEYSHGAELVYVTADGRYGFAGDLYRMTDRTNLSDARRRELRLALLSGEPESSMVVFAPQTTKYTITVFTDVDCGYCRALHKQIAEYNRLGVKVRYLFFPRSGPNTESWSKAEQVWCSAGSPRGPDAGQARRGAHGGGVQAQSNRGAVRAGPCHRPRRHARHRDRVGRTAARLRAAGRAGAGTAAGSAARQGLRH
jgi:thiol:disulfide interchange protein DsbC